MIRDWITISDNGPKTAFRTTYLPKHLPAFETDHKHILLWGNAFSSWDPEFHPLSRASRSTDFTHHTTHGRWGEMSNTCAGNRGRAKAPRGAGQPKFLQIMPRSHFPAPAIKYLFPLFEISPRIIPGVPEKSISTPQQNFYPPAYHSYGCIGQAMYFWSLKALRA